MNKKSVQILNAGAIVRLALAVGWLSPACGKDLYADIKVTHRWFGAWLQMGA